MSVRMVKISGLLVLACMLLAGCGGGGGVVSENHTNRGYNPGVGPFDSRGNYVERWANDKSKGRWWRKGRVTGTSGVAAAEPKREPAPPVIASNTITPPRPAVRQSVRPTPPVRTQRITPAPKPKPKPRRTVKAKPKRKPPIRHTVKKGDTLWALSRKYKTSVGAIQRANSLKGTNLKIGRRLLIPRS